MHPVVPMASSSAAVPPKLLAPSDVGIFDCAASCIPPISGSRGHIGGVFGGLFDAGWSPLVPHGDPPGSTFSYSVAGSGECRYLMVTPPCVAVSSFPPAGCDFSSDPPSSSGVIS